MDKVHRFRLISQAVAHHMIHFSIVMEKRSPPLPKTTQDLLASSGITPEYEIQLKLDSLKCWFLGEYDER